MPNTKPKTTTGVAALTTFLKDDPNPPRAGEIVAFKKACSDEEWQKYCQEAREIVAEKQKDK